MCHRRSLLISLSLLFTVFQSFSQEKSSGWQSTFSVTQRLIGTQNQGELENFSGTVSYAHLTSEYQFKPWLKIGGRINALWHYGVPDINKKDALTNSGPIFERNLWNTRNMSGHSEFELSSLYAEFNWAKNQITVGHFLKETPLVNPEVWPLSNALEGIWYRGEGKRDDHFQVGLITRIAPRFSGDFVGVGTSLGKGGVGVDFLGQTSAYRDNSNSAFLAMAGYKREVSERLSLEIWDYYAENLTNSVFFESKAKLPSSKLNINVMGVYQSKVGNGGNLDQNLAYQRDERALYFGLRLEKQIGQNFLQFNISRITSDGRLLLPREWGLEPFYTFQRRTRIEGNSNVSSVMIKWQRDWSCASGNWSIYSSIGRNRMPNITNFEQNKATVPTHIHTDISIRYEPQHWVKGLSAQFYSAYRFLDEDIDNNPHAIINRANFYHFDFTLNYNFNWK